MILPPVQQWGKSDRKHLSLENLENLHSAECKSKLYKHTWHGVLRQHLQVLGPCSPIKKYGNHWTSEICLHTSTHTTWVNREPTVNREHEWTVNHFLSQTPQPGMLITLPQYGMGLRCCPAPRSMLWCCWSCIFHVSYSVLVLYCWQPCLSPRTLAATVQAHIHDEHLAIHLPQIYSNLICA